MNEPRPAHEVRTGPTRADAFAWLRREVEAHHNAGRITWVYTTNRAEMQWPKVNEAGWAPDWTEDQDPASVLTAAAGLLQGWIEGSRHVDSRGIVIAIDDPDPTLFATMEGQAAPQAVRDLLFVLDHGVRMGVWLRIAWTDMTVLPVVVRDAVNEHATVRRLPGRG